MDRTTVSSGTVWEAQAGYARAVQVGETVHVSGRPPLARRGRWSARGTPLRRRTRRLRTSNGPSARLGRPWGRRAHAPLCTDIDDWEPIGEAHAAYVGDGRPATRLVEVSRLIDPAMLVEIEATAIVC